MKITNLGKFIITFGTTFLVAAVGSLATFAAIPGWYMTLNKTVLTPPNWVFGPVWTLLYILMALAAYLVWSSNRVSNLDIVKEARLLFVGQLVLNTLWSILFFGNHLLLTGFIEIIFLLITIILTTVWFFRISKPAGYLMTPYIAWVSFASILNFLVYLANR